MTNIGRAVAQQSKQLAKDVTKQVVKDLGEIPKGASKQVVGQSQVTSTSGGSKKMINLPTFEVIDVKKEAGKLPSTALKQVTSTSPIVEAIQKNDGKIPQLSPDEVKKLENEGQRRIEEINAEMAKHRKAREEMIKTDNQSEAKQELISKPAEPLQVPSSPTPRGSHPASRKQKKIESRFGKS